MILDAITKTIEAVLGGAPGTQPVAVVNYADITATAATPGAYDVALNGVSAVTIVPAPAASTQRIVKSLSIFNLDSATVTVTVRLNNNSTVRKLIQAILAPNETLYWSMETGWQVRSINGYLQQGAVNANWPLLVKNPVTDAANITTVTVFATGVCQCHYMGPAPKATSSINLLANVTTAVATITWAEVAIYKGTPTLYGNCPDLTRLGYLDVAAIYNSTGLKNREIPLTIAANIGDNIWVVMGASATTPFQVRGALADNLQTGLHQTLTARPSITPGPIGGVLAVAAAIPAWIAIRYN